MPVTSSRSAMKPVQHGLPLISVFSFLIHSLDSALMTFTAYVHMLDIWFSHRPPVTRPRVLELSMAVASALLKPSRSCQRFNELGGGSCSGCSTLVGESSSSSLTAFSGAFCPALCRPMG